MKENYTNFLPANLLIKNGQRSSLNRKGKTEKGKKERISDWVKIGVSIIEYPNYHIIKSYWIFEAKIVALFHVEPTVAEETSQLYFKSMEGKKT